jgi:predicted DNA-binding protein
MKAVNIRLPDEHWKYIEELAKNPAHPTKSQVIRMIVIQHINGSKKGGK